MAGTTAERVSESPRPPAPPSYGWGRPVRSGRVTISRAEWRNAKPRPAKPISIMAHIAGSGTAALKGSRAAACLRLGRQGCVSDTHYYRMLIAPLFRTPPITPKQARKGMHARLGGFRGGDRNGPRVSYGLSQTPSWHEGVPYGWPCETGPT